MKYIGYCRKSREEKDRQILSIEAQVAELKEFAKRENLEIAEFITEEKTAKVPGREKFADLLKKIEKGEASGIVAWHPDRLARNSVDGGKIIYLLDTGKLQNLKFPTHWFENTPQGKFMLSIAFGQSKYYVDNLSENVKRGLRQKLRNGVWPAKAPLGYINNPKTRGIEVDSEKAKIIKKSFEIFSEGNKSFTDISNLLFSLGIRGKKHRLNINQIRKLLSDKFYQGIMHYDGEYHQGTHELFISKDLFKKVQDELNKRDRHFNKSYNFPFLGLIKCKECGAAITAEKKEKYYKGTDRHASYTYYRCTKKLGPCHQQPVTDVLLENQIRNILLEVTLPESWKSDWLNWLAIDEEKERQNIGGSCQKTEGEIKMAEQKLKLLLDGYLEQVVDADTYKEKKNELFLEKIRLAEELQKLKDKGINWLGLMKEFIEKASQLEKIARAKKNSPDLAIGAKMVGSNFFLENRQLGANFSGPFAALRVRALSPSAAEPNFPNSQSVGVPRIGLGVSWSRTKRVTDTLHSVWYNFTTSLCSLNG